MLFWFVITAHGTSFAFLLSEKSVRFMFDIVDMETFALALSLFFRVRRVRGIITKIERD